MTNSRNRRRVALAGVLAAAAIGSAAPAQADAGDKAAKCETRLERIEARFYEIADRRGYEAATQWWETRWQRYHERCVIG